MTGMTGMTGLATFHERMENIYRNQSPDMGLVFSICGNVGQPVISDIPDMETSARTRTLSAQTAPVRQGLPPHKHGLAGLMAADTDRSFPVTAAASVAVEAADALLDALEDEQ